MSFPETDRYWLDVRDFLEQQIQPTDTILAPIDFLEIFPTQIYPYNVSATLSADQFNFIVFHKAMVSKVDVGFTAAVLKQFQPVFANSVFVVYTQNSINALPALEQSAVQALLIEAEHSQVDLDTRFAPTNAAVVTTYNNSAVLAQSLPSIAALGIPTLLVDNGSDEAHSKVNQSLAVQSNFAYLKLPTHQQLPAAINTGISHWLADRNIQWISYFQDNVQVQPDLLSVLALIQPTQYYPVLTGYDAPEHPSVATQLIGGKSVLFKLATSGVHLHASRSYWEAVLPIPTLYSIAEFQTGQSSDADWWITAWSPHSIVKRGGHVICVPNLVKLVEFPQPQFASPQSHARESTAPARAAEQQANLTGVKVLVDGYNLQLTKGTGIKTYGLSLIEGLDRLNAKVDILLSRGGYRSNPILDEVFFFDNPSEKQDWLTISKWMLKSFSPFYRAKRRKSFAGLVVKKGKYTEDFLKYATSFNLPQCYDLANGLYSRLNLTTNVSVAEKIDIWHATYPLPINVQGAKKITTIHDLIPLRLPYATLDSKKVFYNKLRDGLKDSAVTITVSENSKQDILAYYDVDPDKIIVTYQPIALKPLLATDDEVAFFLRRYGLNYQQYILFVGAIEPKKNVGRLLDAYASMEACDLPLVIVGKKGWLWEDELGKTAFMFDNPASQKKVKLLEYISADSLRYLYRGAACLVFPSLYEGFGLPPLEAMNFGCPVITSNVSCLPEICGNAALYVDPYSVQDIKEKMETLLADAKLRTQLVQAGVVNAKSFSMENYVKRLHQAYAQALST